VTIFDLLFLASALAAIVSLVVAAGAAIAGRGAKAIAILKRLGVAVGAYFVLVLIVAAATPQKVLNIGDPGASTTGV
jgi:hypothetical protein